MSSQYPILDDRPIDQWKVTELKEELKRRRLTVRGLKDDLIKRLDDALRAEREDTMKDVDNGLHCDPQDVDDDDTKDAETVSDVSETDKEVVDLSGTTNELMDLGSTKDEVVDGIMVQVDINDGATAFDQGKVQEEQITGRIDSSRVDENSKAQREGEDSKPQLEDENSKAQAEDEDSKLQLEDENSKTQLEDENSKAQLDNEDSKPPREDTMLKSSALNNQVSEVSPNLGFQVKSDSISTDSVSINETIELKDNIIVDNVKLEIDVKPKMVEPSSSEVVPVGGESHPMDVEEPRENKVYVEEKGDSNVTNAEMNKKNDSADLGYSEKLNLDRSSGDDSMEEDVLETKQIDSEYNPDEGGDRNEKSEMNVEESTVDVRRHGFAADKKDVQVENKSPLAVPVEKRKLHDQEATGPNEPVKRQRRWSSESLKVPESRSPNITSTTTPKDTFQSPTLKRNFSRSDSSNSEDALKERVVPPSSKPPTNSLKIDRFLRPFTLKAVQELLGKTGTVTSFWMDHIKTHCYVTYSSVEEATETRNAVYNLQWPPNGGRLLAAEFVDPQEVKIRAETPQTPTTPVTPVSTGPTVPAAPPKRQPQPSPRQASRQQLPPPPTLPPPPPLSNPPTLKEWLPPPPPLPEKVDPPIVTLDDLFRKTKATPRIYYLPLSEEQVASKLLPRDRNTKQ